MQASKPRAWFERPMDFKQKISSGMRWGFGKLSSSAFERAIARSNRTRFLGEVTHILPRDPMYGILTG